MIKKTYFYFFSSHVCHRTTFQNILQCMNNDKKSYFQAPTILSKATVVLRFLGTSPDSSYLRRLLQSVCEQIVICYGKDRKEVG